MGADFNWSFGGLGESAKFRAAVLRSGKVFGGRFRIEGIVGEGAMGQVFAAHDESADRPVAIKVMHASLDERSRARFKREGELTASLRHPGIVRVHGGGITEEGQPFLVMELIEGARTLHAVEEEEDRLARIERLIEVARAVGHAHELGIVHRDLKPGNILVDARGRMRVCDFGLAWREGVERLTQTGAFVGTPIYMAPERFTSSTARPPSDVWSLGVLLYQALTDQLPFETDGSLASLLAQIANSNPPRPRRVARGVSLAVERVCLCALSKDPDDRFLDANTFADSLEEALHAGAARSRVWGFLGYLAIGCVAIGAIVAAGPWSGEAEPPPPPVVPPPPSDSGPATAVPVGEAARALLTSAVERSRVPAGLRQGVLDDFEAARRLAGTDPAFSREVDLQQLDYLFRRGRWEEVCNLARPLQRHEGHLGTRAGLLHALALYELMRRDEAAKVARSAWKRSDGRPRQAEDYAVGAWMNVLAHEPEEALELASLGLTIDPDHVELILAAGSAHGLKLNMVRARELLDRAHRLAPDHPTVHRGLISVAVHLQHQDRAARLVERLMRLVEPDPPLVVLRCQGQIYLNGRRREEARYVFERILQRAPGDAHASVSLALILLQQRREGEARALLRKAHARDPAAFDEALSILDPLPMRERVRALVEDD